VVVRSPPPEIVEEEEEVVEQQQEEQSTQCVAAAVVLDVVERYPSFHSPKPDKKSSPRTNNSPSPRQNLKDAASPNLPRRSPKLKKSPLADVSVVSRNSIPSGHQIVRTPLLKPAAAINQNDTPDREGDQQQKSESAQASDLQKSDVLETPNVSQVYEFVAPTPLPPAKKNLIPLGCQIPRTPSLAGDDAEAAEDGEPPVTDTAMPKGKYINESQLPPPPPTPIPEPPKEDTEEPKDTGTRGKKRRNRSGEEEEDDKKMLILEVVDNVGYVEDKGPAAVQAAVVTNAGLNDTFDVVKPSDFLSRSRSKESIDSWKDLEADIPALPVLPPLTKNRAPTQQGKRKPSKKEDSALEIGEEEEEEEILSGNLLFANGQHQEAPRQPLPSLTKGRVKTPKKRLPTRTRKKKNGEADPEAIVEKVETLPCLTKGRAKTPNKRPPSRGRDRAAINKGNANLVVEKAASSPEPASVVETLPCLTKGRAKTPKKRLPSRGRAKASTEGSVKDNADKVEEDESQSSKALTPVGEDVGHKTSGEILGDVTSTEPLLTSVTKNRVQTPDRRQPSVGHRRAASAAVVVAAAEKRRQNEIESPTGNSATKKKIIISRKPSVQKSEEKNEPDLPPSTAIPSKSPTQATVVENEKNIEVGGTRFRFKKAASNKEQSSNSEEIADLDKKKTKRSALKRGAESEDSEVLKTKVKVKRVAPKKSKISGSPSELGMEGDEQSISEMKNVPSQSEKVEGATEEKKKAVGGDRSITRKTNNSARDESSLADTLQDGTDNDDKSESNLMGNDPETTPSISQEEVPTKKKGAKSKSSATATKKATPTQKRAASKRGAKLDKVAVQTEPEGEVLNSLSHNIEAGEKEYAVNSRVSKKAETASSSSRDECKEAPMNMKRGSKRQELLLGTDDASKSRATKRGIKSDQAKLQTDLESESTLKVKGSISGRSSKDSKDPQTTPSSSHEEILSNKGKAYKQLEELSGSAVNSKKASLSKRRAACKKVAKNDEVGLNIEPEGGVLNSFLVSKKSVVDNSLSEIQRDPAEISDKKDTTFKGKEKKELMQQEEASCSTDTYKKTTPAKKRAAPKRGAESDQVAIHPEPEGEVLNSFLVAKESVLDNSLAEIQQDPAEKTDQKETTLKEKKRKGSKKQEEASCSHDTSMKTTSAQKRAAPKRGAKSDQVAIHPEPEGEVLNSFTVAKESVVDDSLAEIQQDPAENTDKNETTLKGKKRKGSKQQDEALCSTDTSIKTTSAKKRAAPKRGAKSDKVAIHPEPEGEALNSFSVAKESVIDNSLAEIQQDPAENTDKKVTTLKGKQRKGSKQQEEAQRSTDTYTPAKKRAAPKRGAKSAQVEIHHEPEGGVLNSFSANNESAVDGSLAKDEAKNESTMKRQRNGRINKDSKAPEATTPSSSSHEEVVPTNIRNGSKGQEKVSCSTDTSKKVTPAKKRAATKRGSKPDQVVIPSEPEAETLNLLPDNNESESSSQEVKKARKTEPVAAKKRAPPARITVAVKGIAGTDNSTEGSVNISKAATPKKVAKKAKKTETEPPENMSSSRSRISTRTPDLPEPKVVKKTAKVKMAAAVAAGVPAKKTKTRREIIDAIVEDVEPIVSSGLPDANFCPSFFTYKYLRLALALSLVKTQSQLLLERPAP
jgi:hypothetical protein